MEIPRLKTIGVDRCGAAIVCYLPAKFGESLMSMVVRSLLAQTALAVVVLVAGTSLNSARAAWKETVRINFEHDEDGSGLGYAPRFGVLRVGSTIYGVTTKGGIGKGGVVYRRASGKLTVLYSFTDGDTTKDGCGYQPSSSLIKDRSKNVLYGTTYSGGEFGGGVVYSLTPGASNSPWKCKALHKFANSGSNRALGYAPFGGLLPSGGVLYGTTQYNTLAKDSTGVTYPTGGVIFRVSTDGSGYKAIYKFNTAVTQGTVPAGPVVEGPDGLLYGATFFGGTGKGGVIYKIKKDGTGYVVLHAFNKGTSAAIKGYQPTQGPLLIDGTDIYGVTSLGGCKLDANTPNCADTGRISGGVLFKLKRSNNFYSVLHTFDSNNNLENGYSPYGGLITDGTGWIYGVNQFGGSQNSGTVFRFNKSSKAYAVLSDLGGDFGVMPSGRLTFDADKNLYGTAASGGNDNGGVLFFLDKP